LIEALDVIPYPFPLRAQLSVALPTDFPFWLIRKLCAEQIPADPSIANAIPKIRSFIVTLLDPSDRKLGEELRHPFHRRPIRAIIATR
jgi:hypothetical protein